MTQQQLTIQQVVLTAAHHNFRKQLRRYALSKVNSPILAEDLLQDTFLRAWKFMRNGGEVESMKSFLYQILHNLIIDLYRKNKAKPLSLDDLVENGYEPRITEGGFEHVADILEGRRAILLIHKLPNLYRNVLAMRFVEHLSIEEIAGKVGQTRNTVAVQIHRGLAKLGKLKEYSNH